MSIDTKVMSASGSAGASVIGTNPWLIAIIVSVATFMEVLDTTIANVALRYISGGLAIGPSQAAWVVTSYLRQLHRSLRQQLVCQGVRTAQLFSFLHRAIHAQFDSLRICAKSLFPSLLSGAAGTGGRRHDTGCSIHPGGCLSSQ
jgi:hypothetical protein